MKLLLKFTCLKILNTVGASTKMYGHVILSDVLGVSAPDPSSTSEDTASNSILGIAASPRMVWDVREELRDEMSDIPTVGGISVGDIGILITNANQIVEFDFSNGITVQLMKILE